MNKRPLLVVFAKAPRLGTVKTRLARRIGSVAARDFYQQMLRDTLMSARRVIGVDVCLGVTPDRFAHQGRFWPARVSTWPQGQGDLGHRMANQFNILGCDRDMVLVGSDIPQMDDAMLTAAFQHLAAGNHGVFGPAEDGGFWLVGFRAGRFPPGLFRNVRWSHKNTYADVRSALPSHYRIAEIDTLNDIDDLSDYQRYIHKC